MTAPEAAAIREVFRRNMFCVVATATPTGEPWLSPVFFNYSPDFRLFWESAHDAQHSQNLRLNPRVAIFVKDTAAHGPATDLYIAASALEVPPERLAGALDAWWNGPHGHSDRAKREVSDYGPSKPLRLYEASIQALFVLSETVVDDYRVDTRVEVDMALLSEDATRHPQ